MTTMCKSGNCRLCIRHVVSHYIPHADDSSSSVIRQCPLTPAENIRLRLKARRTNNTSILPVHYNARWSRNARYDPYQSGRLNRQMIRTSPTSNSFVPHEVEPQKKPTRLRKLRNWLDKIGCSHKESSCQ